MAQEKSSTLHSNVKLFLPQSLLYSAMYSWLLDSAAVLSSVFRCSVMRRTRLGSQLQGGRWTSAGLGPLSLASSSKMFSLTHLLGKGDTSRLVEIYFTDTFISLLILSLTFSLCSWNKAVNYSDKYCDTDRGIDILDQRNKSSI